MTSIFTAKDPEQAAKAGGLSLDITIIELLASRICHDLISPIGAVQNGVEFMEEMGSTAGNDDAIGLINHSAQTALGRLQAFRMAYGAGGRDADIKPEDVYNTFGSFLESEGKVTQEWDPHGDLGMDTYPPGYCKILISVLLMAYECLHKGGTVSVGPGAGNETLVRAEGPAAVIHPQVGKALALDMTAEDLTPRLIHPYVLALLAGHYGFRLHIAEEQDGKAVFSIKSL